jgi:3-phenylpropionate/trans-cinnamate dioxygenase ferredoxin subunit
MSSFIKVAETVDFQDGAKKKVTAGGKELLLVKVSGSYYAIDNRCPHMGGNLSAGQLKGSVITCPLHGSQFDVTDGRVVRWLKGSGILTAIGKVMKSPRPIPTYKVKVEGEDIFIEV